jgi:hypothetical protein
MKILLGMAVIAAALASSGPAGAAAEKAPQAKSQAAKSDATDFSALRRHYRHGYLPQSRPHYRAYYGRNPTYLARPVYYRSIGYPPALFSFNVGVGFGPYWW